MIRSTGKRRVAPVLDQHRDELLRHGLAHRQSAHASPVEQLVTVERERRRGRAADKRKRALLAQRLKAGRDDHWLPGRIDRVVEGANRTQPLGEVISKRIQCVVGTEIEAERAPCSNRIDHHHGARAAQARGHDCPKADAAGAATATVLPGFTSSTFSTAPAPVCTPQPSGAAVANEMSPGRRTNVRARAIACVASDDWPKK